MAIAAPKAKTACSDKIDNDGDGYVDLADAGCTDRYDTTEDNCGDGVCTGDETSATCPEDCGYPDSCSDTDGSNIYSLGTASGYLNDTPYNDNDYCVGDDVIEYTCNGIYEINTQISCGTDFNSSFYCFNSSVWMDNNNYFCANGACDSMTTQYFIEFCPYGCFNGTCA